MKTSYLFVVNSKWMRRLFCRPEQTKRQQALWACSKHRFRARSANMGMVQWTACRLWAYDHNYGSSPTKSLIESLQSSPYRTRPTDTTTIPSWCEWSDHYIDGSNNCRGSFNPCGPRMPYTVPGSVKSCSTTVEGESDLTYSLTSNWKWFTRQPPSCPAN